MKKAFPTVKKRKAKENEYVWSINGITVIQTCQTCKCFVQLSIVMHKSINCPINTIQQHHIHVRRI